MKNLITGEIGATGYNNYEKYLGVPVVVGRSTHSTFLFIKEMVWQKIQNWKNVFLSKVGKEIMIKTVIQAISTYSMSVFRIPRKLCEELVALMARFWWRQGKKK